MFGRHFLATFCLVFTNLVPGAANSQNQYPNRAVRLIVPFPTGGGNDVLSRVISAKLAEKWGQPVLVDNKPGAGGNIGAEAVVQSVPDGYSLLLGTSTLAINPYLQKSVPFDVIKDLAAIARIAETPFALVVPISSPLQSVKDLIVQAKANPGKMSYASVGIGTPHHLGMELFKLTTHIDVTHVPYRGSVAALTELASGQTQMMFASVNAAIPFVQRKELKILAVAAAQRLAGFPQTPTIIESGYPGFEVSSWYGIMIRSGTPPPIQKKLSEDILEVISEADVKEKLVGAGFEPAPAGADQLRSILVGELEKWGAVVQKAGIKPE